MTNKEGEIWRCQVTGVMSSLFHLPRGEEILICKCMQIGVQEMNEIEARSFFLRSPRWVVPRQWDMRRIVLRGQLINRILFAHTPLLSVTHFAPFKTTFIPFENFIIEMG